MATTWTDEMVATLKRMRDEERPAEMIAKALGVTSRALGEKVKRLKLPKIPRNRRTSGILPRADRASPIPLPPRIIVGDGMFVPFAGVEPVPFGSPGCKWPVAGSGADTLCCGAERIDGPYCWDHHIIAHQAHTPKLKVPKGAINQRVRHV